MMDADRLFDILTRGMGQAARVVGERYDVFRPTSAELPVAWENRIMQLPVLFSQSRGSAGPARQFGRLLIATCDCVRIRVGDYLRGPRGVLFFAALPPVSRPLCALTNVTFDVFRSMGAGRAGLSGYGGVVDSELARVLAGWPAQMGSRRSDRHSAVPAGPGQSMATVVMPATPVAIEPGDLMVDEGGRRFIVSSAELTEMGVLLGVRGTEV